jgi:deoxyxylulose-5-phosphate synthase
MKSLLLLGMLLGIVAASNLNDFSALLSYESFAKDFAKEAIVTFAENLAEEGSNDFCQDFATFLAKSAVEKYSAIENKVSY